MTALMRPNGPFLLSARFSPLQYYINSTYLLVVRLGDFTCAYFHPARFEGREVTFTYFFFSSGMGVGDRLLYYGQFFSFVALSLGIFFFHL
jgi:hypothetical protein